MEAIMLFYRMIYTDKCLVENFFRYRRNTICYRLGPDRSSSHHRHFSIPWT